MSNGVSNLGPRMQRLARLERRIMEERGGHGSTGSRSRAARETSDAPRGVLGEPEPRRRLSSVSEGARGGHFHFHRHHPHRGGKPGPFLSAAGPGPGVVSADASRSNRRPFSQSNVEGVKHGSTMIGARARGHRGRSRSIPRKWIASASAIAPASASASAMRLSIEKIGFGQGNSVANGGLTSPMIVSHGPPL